MADTPERIALDVHAHLAPIFPDELSAIDGVTWKPDARTLVVDGYAVGMKPLFDPPALVAWMDRNNVASAWISIPPPLYRAHLQGDAARTWATYANNGLQRISEQYPDRLAPLPHLPLQAPEIANEIAKDWIARGHRRFGAPSGGHGEQVLSDKVYEPLWQTLNDAGAFVFFHPGECADGRLTAFYLSNLLGNPYETAVAIGHLQFGGVFERFANIKFCFAHGGGVLPMLAGRFERGFDTARPDIDTKAASPRKMFHNVCVDCITHDPDALKLAEQVFGETNVVFGSDWPFPMGLVEPHQQMAALDPQRRKRIFCDNPERLTKGDSTMRGPSPRRPELGPIGDKILFENDYVRIWSVKLDPGERQAWHKHDLPYVIVPMTEGKNIMYFEDGREKETNETVGGVLWREPGAPHELLNISDWQYRNVLIEIKTPATSGH